MAEQRTTQPAHPTDWTTQGCSVGAALDVVGDRATFLVVREVGCGVRRFADMQQRTGLPRDVLSRRLARMVADGLLRRVPYQEAGARVRHEYRFTPKGFALYPVMVALWDWGTRWAGPATGSGTDPGAGSEPGPDPATTGAAPAVEFVHRGCDTLVHAVTRCEAGHDVTEPRDVLPRPGPGALRRVPAA